MEVTDGLFWFAGRDGQYTVATRTLEDAKRQMTAKGLTWDRCGEVHGPGDGMPPGQWMELRD
jgi:hypothetical protein